MKRIKLEPCPHCGAEAEIMHWGCGEGFYTAQCQKCHASTPLLSTPEDAIKAWNRRV